MLRIDDLPKPKYPTINIRRKETTTELLGQKPEDVKYLIVDVDKAADLSLLADYPNVEALLVSGDLANVDDISQLKKLSFLSLDLPAVVDLSNIHAPGLKRLSLYRQLNEGFEGLISEKLEYLEIKEMRKLNDLLFIEKAIGLKKLYLMSLPAVEKFPDFGKLPNLYGLKVYELHKLNDIESLTRSNIKYLALTISADKLTGTKLADVLLRMEKLEGADMGLDRSSVRRETVLENALKKAGRAELLNMDMGWENWKLL